MIRFFFADRTNSNGWIKSPLKSYGPSREGIKNRLILCFLDRLLILFCWMIEDKIQSTPQKNTSPQRTSEEWSQNETLQIGASFPGLPFQSSLDNSSSSLSESLEAPTNSSSEDNEGKEENRERRSNSALKQVWRVILLAPESWKYIPFAILRISIFFFF